MGMDIYCRWETADDHEWQHQYTGFVTAPEAGYLRYSYGAAAWVKETAATLGVPSPIDALFPGWQVSRDDVLVVTPAEMDRLRGVRAETISALAAGLHGPVEPGDVDLFEECLRNMWRFIDFVEAHADRPGLRIEFA